MDKDNRRASIANLQSQAYSGVFANYIEGCISRVVASDGLEMVEQSQVIVAAKMLPCKNKWAFSSRPS
jgi:hypothetical protein